MAGITPTPGPDTHAAAQVTTAVGGVPSGTSLTDVRETQTAVEISSEDDEEEDDHDEDSEEEESEYERLEESIKVDPSLGCLFDMYSYLPSNRTSSAKYSTPPSVHHPVHLPPSPLTSRLQTPPSPSQVSARSVSLSAPLKLLAYAQYAIARRSERESGLWWIPRSEIHGSWSLRR